MTYSCIAYCERGRKEILIKMRRARRLSPCAACTAVLPNGDNLQLVPAGNNQRLYIFFLLFFIFGILLQDVKTLHFGRPSDLSIFFVSPYILTAGKKIV